MKKISFLIVLVLFTFMSVKAQLTGSGTELDSYQIATIDDLKFLRDQVNLSTNTSEELTSIYQKAGVYFKLTANIDLTTEDWTPIGNVNNAFKSFRGIFDGNGFKILNLKIGSSSTRATLAQAGLFAYCTNNTVLKNLTIENAAVYNGTVASLNQTAILVANANLTTIHNCHVSGIADCLHTSKGIQVGGIVAYGIDLTLINSSANVTISAESPVNTGIQIAVNSGGLVSVLAVSSLGSIIKNCFSKGTIIATSAMPSGTGNYVYAGGIVANSSAGNATYQNNIINCYSASTITSTSAGTVTSFAGGISGSNGNYNTVSNCIALNPSIILNSGGTIKSANRITGNNAATGTVLADNYASETLTITGYTPTSSITGKDGEDLGVNVPKNLLNSYIQFNEAPAGFNWLFWETNSGINGGLPYFLNSPPTTTNVIQIDKNKFYVSKGKIIFYDCVVGKEIAVYNIKGEMVKQSIFNSNHTEIELPAGLYFVIGGQKVLVY